MKDQTYFCKNWLEGQDFKYCIKETKDRTETRCTVCHKSFKLPNIGRQALLERINRRNFDKRQISFQILVSKVAEKPSGSGEY